MIEPGTLLQNRYLLNDQIGQGGMGAVYIATDQRFGSTVAVKETFFTDVNLRKAFEREARLLNSLRHNALPRVSDHFVEGEGQFLVMEFIGGDDLSSLLEKNKGPFPVDRVLGWADQLLDALEYLHEQTPTIIHRDIKPQNLKLTDRDHIILLDFGLAKGAPSNLSRVTNTGSVFGYSRSYAPLEQIQGAGTDTRSDLYSLAATLYHLLTGVTPPDAVTRATAVINGQEDPMVPANEINPKVSPAVAAVLASALTQNANQRPASAREMRHALETADRTPGAGRATAAVGNHSTIHDQATQILTPRTAPMTGAQGFVAAGAATVADPILQGTGTDPRQAENTKGDSKVTVVATPAASSPRGRVRQFAYVAAAIALLGGSAFGVYRYTKQNQTPSPVPVQNVTVTAPVASPSPAATVTPTPAVTDTTSQTTTPKTKQTTKTTTGGGNNVTVGDPDVEPPDPDDEDPLPPPGRPGHRPPTGDPGEAERIRAAEEKRRIMIQVQRDMHRRRAEEKRRQQQQQQQQNQGNRPRGY